MLKVFASVPMKDRTEEAIRKYQKDCLEYAKKELKRDDCELIETYLKEDVPPDAGRLWFLGSSISLMDKADVVVIYIECNDSYDWFMPAGVQAEKKVAELYGKMVLQNVKCI